MQQVCLGFQFSQQADKPIMGSWNPQQGNKRYDYGNKSGDGQRDFGDRQRGYGDRSRDYGNRQRYQGDRYRDNGEEGENVQNTTRYGNNDKRRDGNGNDMWRGQSNYQRRGFKQPDQSDIPQSITKDLTDILIKKNGQNDVQNYKMEHKITIRKENNRVVDDILFSFDDLNLSSEIKQVLVNQNYEKPSLIQAVAIPQSLNGDDVINLAQTGSGKTLAFIMSALLHIEKQQKSNSPRILVLAPTRELVIQIQNQFDLFDKIIKTTVVYGGQPKHIQFRNLSYKNDVIIATPGRMIDFINEGYPLSTITQVILDEADRMLDMGFEPQLRQILQNVRPDRQTLFFSATWPRQVQQLARDFCQQNPSLVQIGSSGLTLNKDIKQEIKILNRYDRDNFLKDVMKSFSNSKVLIFCERKQDTKNLTDLLLDQGLEVNCLHGDLEQNERDYRMKKFRSGEVKVLVATNLASRGLDVSDIELVVNYDFPQSIEDYVHRIGRTGRAGKTGIAISMIEHNFSNPRILQDTKQEIPEKLHHLAR